MKIHTRISLFAALTLFAPALQAAVIISPSAGFSITWDGNDGDHFNAANPAPVPANLATGAGATPFASSELGLGIHLTSTLNDGLYGNSNSWIGNDVPGTPFAGISLGGAFNLTGLAFGRDNGNNVTDPAGGQLTDRSVGLYTVQFTAVASPGALTPDTGNAISGWQNLGTLNYTASVDDVLGGGFTSYFRHEYDISTAGGGAVTATGIRLLVPGTGISPAGTAIDEIEIFGAAVPEPSTTLMFLGALAGIAGRRRR